LSRHPAIDLKKHAKEAFGEEAGTAGRSLNLLNGGDSRPKTKVASHSHALLAQGAMNQEGDEKNGKEEKQELTRSVYP